MVPRTEHDRLPLGVRLLGGVSFLNDVASEMVYPLLPGFLAATLGAGPGFLGLLEGMAETLSSLSKGWFGAWSDRARRREPFVLAGYVLAAGARPFLALATLPGQVFGIRLVDRLGKGLRTAPRDAWLASLGRPEQRGRIFGYHRAMDHLGSVLGPLVAAAVLWRWPGAYRELFAWTWVPGLLAVLLLGLAMVRSGASRAAPPAPARHESMRWSELPLDFRRYLVAIGVFTLGNSTDAFLLLRLQQSGVALAWLPLLWAALHLVKSSTSLWGGRLADRLGARLPISLAWFWYALIYLLFALELPQVLRMAVFLAYGIFFGLSEAPEKAWISKLIPQERLGAGYGMFHLVVGLGALPASLLFGALWQQGGPALAFGVGSALALAACLLLQRVGSGVETTSRG